VAEFRFNVLLPDGKTAVYRYDNADSTLFLEGRRVVVEGGRVKRESPELLSARIEGRKLKEQLRVLRIKLGLSCNYACAYCLQAKTDAESGLTPRDVDALVEKIQTAICCGGDDARPLRIEFWGGEPFVYWAALKPLAEKLRVLYPKAVFLLITNASLLDDEKIDWLDALGFGVGVSHDGPGQFVRGKDPFDDERTRAAILTLYARLAPQGRLSFNPVIHRGNGRRKHVVAYFDALFPGDEHLRFGEGRLVSPTNAAGLRLCFTAREHVAYRRAEYLSMLRDEQVWRFYFLHHVVNAFLDSLETETKASEIGTSCVADGADSVSIDREGKVLLCNNVADADFDARGRRLRFGNLSNLDAVRVDTRRFLYRQKGSTCFSCPVLHICHGTCPIEDDPRFQRAACDNAFSDSVLGLAYAIRELSGGGLLTRIDGEGLTEERRDIFGLQETGDRKRETGDRG
jgi:uncharacterized protein